MSFLQIALFFWFAFVAANFAKARQWRWFSSAVTAWALTAIVLVRA